MATPSARGITTGGAAGAPPSSETSGEGRWWTSPSQATRPVSPWMGGRSARWETRGWSCRAPASKATAPGGEAPSASTTRPLRASTGASSTATRPPTGRGGACWWSTSAPSLSPTYPAPSIRRGAAAVWRRWGPVGCRRKARPSSATKRRPAPSGKRWSSTAAARAGRAALSWAAARPPSPSPPAPSVGTEPRSTEPPYGWGASPPPSPPASTRPPPARCSSGSTSSAVRTTPRAAGAACSTGAWGCARTSRGRCTPRLASGAPRPAPTSSMGPPTPQTASSGASRPPRAPPRPGLLRSPSSPPLRSRRPAGWCCPPSPSSSGTTTPRGWCTGGRTTPAWRCAGPGPSTPEGVLAREATPPPPTESPTGLRALRAWKACS
mmetsp:Transcript_37035/g.116513  ORF Transcript_37035/g.116513 Transcript_37035/m.116513 type:complete len:380 (+) Transcript_37035:1574-2713(+)